MCIIVSPSQDFYRKLFFLSIILTIGLVHLLTVAVLSVAPFEEIIHASQSIKSLRWHEDIGNK